MDAALPAEDLRFRDEVRAFIAAHLTDELRMAGSLCAGMYCDRPVAQRWMAILDQRGWATPAWPVEYGGAGLNAVQNYILASELAEADAPPITPNATGMIGPVLIAFGTPAQKAAYLRRIQTGEDWWAQGYSEPGAGSDLASLRTRAVRDGDDYVINGSKIWTSHAQWSNRIFCLVRTRFDGKPQAGISFLVFDMDLPGIVVRPIITLAGDHEVNEVFFKDVRVPASGLIGAENDGWTIAKYLLDHERGGQYAPKLRRRIRHLRTLLAERADAWAQAELEDLRMRVAEAEIALDALHIAELRVIAARGGGKSATRESSMLKLQGTELQQRIDEIGLETVGDYAAPYQHHALHALQPNDAIGPQDLITLTARYLNNRAASIYAGSNEIQRNIIAGDLLRA
ncbi:MAG: acyl-CoA dehydrogenase family protein [Hyphomonadaceae bacterium]